MAPLLSYVYLFCFLLNVYGYAKDFGVHGHTFTIQEDDLLQLIIQKVQSLSQEDILKFEHQSKERITQKCKEPPPLENIKEATKKRVFYFDPTILVNQDILDHEGHIIVKKGARFNPLESTQLGKELLFFDATQASHLQWAKSHCSSAQWILVKGKPLDLENQEKRPIFFDQYGVLTKKLEIRCVPAKVSQEGLLLKIEEIPIEEALCKKS